MDILSMSVTELRAELAAAGVDSAGCIEKADLQARVATIRAQGRAPKAHPQSSSSTSAPPPSSPSTPASPNDEAIRQEIRRIKSSAKDYYKVLNVPRDASENDIKKAYHKLALRIHPDKCSVPGAEEAFKIVSQACDVLTKKRGEYDMGGEEGVHGHAGGVDPREFFRDFEDIFGPGFGGGGGVHFMGPGTFFFSSDARQRRPRQGRAPPQPQQPEFIGNQMLVKVGPG